MNWLLGLSVWLLGLLIPIWNQTIHGRLPGIKGHQIDPGGKLWVWSDQVLRVHQSDTLTFDQSYLQSGNVHSIDVYNPLKILLFFKDQSQIIWADNRGAALSSAINLMDLGLEQASAVATGYDNGLWVVTGQDMTLVRLNQQLKTEFKVPNLHRLTNDPQAEIAWMLEHQNRLFLVSTSGMVSVWDIFGGLISVFKAGGLTETTSLHRGSRGIYFQNNQEEIQITIDPPRPPEIKTRTTEKEGFYIDWQKDTYRWHANPDKK
jgi:hypothetical protein